MPPIINTDGTTNGLLSVESTGDLASSFGISPLFLVYQTNDNSQTQDLYYSITSDAKAWQSQRITLGQKVSNCMAAATFGKIGYIAYRGNDGFIWLSSDENNFNPISTESGKLPVGTCMAMVDFNGVLCLAYQIDDGSHDIWLATTQNPAFDPLNNTNWKTAPIPYQRAGACMTMTVFFNGKLCIACQGDVDSHTIYLITSTDLVNWSAFPIPDQSAGACMAMAVFDGRLCIAYQANDNSHGIYLTSSTDLVQWSINRIHEQNVGECMAMTVFNDRLCLAYQSDNGNKEIWFVSSNDFVNWPGSPIPEQMAGACMAMTLFPWNTVYNPNPVIADWSFSLPDIGNVGEYDSGFMEAGGIAIVGFGDAASTFQINYLGDNLIAIGITLSDNKPYYWNSHYGTSDNANNNGMVLWQSNDYAASSIGSEQRFKLVNLGDGKVALQATAGAYPEAYLSGMQGGWYQQQQSLGSGSFIAAPEPAPFQVHGDLLPILFITGSGFQLDLSGRDLGSLNLNLSNADMRECNLSNAVLSGITGLEDADFTGAILKGAQLDGLSLTGADWSKADFTGTKLSGLTSAKSAKMPGAIFDGADLTGVVFSDAILAGASFVNADLSSANFSGADLSGANLTGAILANTNFQACNLQGTAFNGTNLSTAQFDPYPNFSRSATNRTHFVGATLPFTVISNNWSWLDLSSASILEIPPAIANLLADHALLPSGLDLQGIDLTGASFVGTQMYEIRLQQANLQDANLTNARLKGAVLTKANLANANFDSAYLIAEQAVGEAILDSTKLESAVAINALMFNTVLDGAHCDGVDFSGAVFVTAAYLGGGRQASAVGASMNFAKFNNASVVLAVFNGAQLSAADFSNAVMVGASFQNNGANATQLTPSSDVSHTDASLYKADIRGVNFSGANMDGLNMNGAIYTPSSGEFCHDYQDVNGKTVPVAFKYGPTVLGNTTTQTTCPDGNSGPCALSAKATRGKRKASKPVTKKK